MATEVLPDERTLRSGRRQRALAQMAAHDLDVLVLGRQANVRYVTGAPQLWVAGTRPFGPSCVLVRETGARAPPQHLGRGHSRGHSAREPVRHLVESDEHHGGAAAHRRRGYRPARRNRCALTGFRATAADRVSQCRSWSTANSRCGPPGASRPTRRLTALRESVAVAESALAAAVSELRPGASEQSTGRRRCWRPRRPAGSAPRRIRMSAWVTSRKHPWRRADGDWPYSRRRSGGVFGRRSGGRLRRRGRPDLAGRRQAAPRGAAALYGRWERLWDRLIDACQPGRGSGRTAGRVPGRGRARAADAGRARPGHGVRPARRFQAPAYHRGRRNAWSRAWCWP